MPEDPKAKVFAHWDHLNSLCRRRFPKSENLADEALLYMLDKLESDDWRRVRAWEGLGDFLPFIVTLASRLLTDFTRERFGHIRKPSWLANRKDPLWHSAYRLLVVEKYEREAAVEILRISEPNREAWFIERVVKTILEKCHSRPQYQEQIVSIENMGEQSSPDLEPDEALTVKEREMLEALEGYLVSYGEPDEAIDNRVAELQKRLQNHVRLSDEDRLLLRMRYVDGVNMKTIVRLLNLSGDPYKRFNRLIRQLRRTCMQAGLLDE
jgi:hypothetical protein